MDVDKNNHVKPYIYIYIILWKQYICNPVKPIYVYYSEISILIDSSNMI